MNANLTSFLKFENWKTKYCTFIKNKSSLYNLQHYLIEAYLKAYIQLTLCYAGKRLSYLYCTPLYLQYIMFVLYTVIFRKFSFVPIIKSYL